MNPQILGIWKTANLANLRGLEVGQVGGGGFIGIGDLAVSDNFGNVWLIAPHRLRNLFLCMASQPQLKYPLVPRVLRILINPAEPFADGARRIRAALHRPASDKGENRPAPAVPQNGLSAGDDRRIRVVCRKLLHLAAEQPPRCSSTPPGRSVYPTSPHRWRWWRGGRLLFAYFAVLQVGDARRPKATFRFIKSHHPTLLVEFIHL